MLQGTNAFLEHEPLICREFYDYYRTHRRKVAKGIDQYMLFEKAVSGLLRLLRRLAVDTEGGIYIKGLGYFCHVKNYKKIKNRKGRNFFEKLKKVNTYTYWFFPDGNFEGWYIMPAMDDSKVLINLESYKLHFDAIKSYHSAKTMQQALSTFHGHNIQFK